MASELVKHVVLDSGAFLRNAPVQSIAENSYTVEGVVNEIRDKATRQRLQVLPYQLNFRQPSADAIKAVTDFAKKTGDYKSLSAVDLQVMALTYQLEKEHVGTDHLKTVPDKKAEWNASRRPLEKATDIAGFYIKPKTQNVQSRTVSEDSAGQTTADKSDVTLERLQPAETADKIVDTDTDTEQQVRTVTETVSEDTVNIVSNDRTGGAQNDTCISNTDNSVQKCVEDGQVISAECLEEESEDEVSEEEEEEDDDDGWITPSNIKDVKEKMGMIDMTKADVQIPVGCLTTDFAMQNVLIQMGLNVLSVDGMLIKRAKSFVLRCFACMKITTNIQKSFCPHCGNNTLTKVSMTVNEDGSIRYFLSRRKPVTTRGMNVSLPHPVGGKHANNPILVEDQPVPQHRPSKKSQQKMNVFDPDYVSNMSPFSVNDVTSRAAQLGIRGNRNQRDRKYGRRK